MDAKELKRVVVIGGGFAGLNFVKHLDRRYYHVTLIDRNNYHSFPPLFYQVASSGLDPSSICFPLRRELRKHGTENPIVFNMGEVDRIDTRRRSVFTAVEEIPYDILLIAAGTTNNFFNMPQLHDQVYTLKSTSEALRCRNDILGLLERASIVADPAVRKQMLSFVVVGGGPTGVEIAGAIGEMKRYVLPREYPRISQDEVSITIVEGTDRLLRTMSEVSSANAERELKSLMVDVRLGQNMKEYAEGAVTLADGTVLPTGMLIWTAGIKAVPFKIQDGVDAPDRSHELTGPGGRFLVNADCSVKGLENVYALGDIALMADVDPDFPKGHPQLAQVAIQQGRMVAKNLNAAAKAEAKGEKAPELKPFRYNDKGSMATVGRNRAVVDMKRLHLSGFPAWAAWMFIHLISILGMRNKLTVLINWIWAYFNYSTSLRLLIHPSRYPLRPDGQG